MTESVEGLVIRNMIESREADVKRLYKVLDDLYEKFYAREISLDELQPEVDALNKLYDELILLKGIVLEAQWVKTGNRS